MKNFIYLCIAFYLAPLSTYAKAEAQVSIIIRVMDENQRPIEAATVEIQRTEHAKIQLTTNAKGQAHFSPPSIGIYTVVAMALNHKTSEPVQLSIPSEIKFINLVLSGKVAEISEVSVVAKKQIIQRDNGKTLINVDASITNVGTSVLEILEKSPGVMVDKNGTISLQGKPGVLVLIDDRPTYLEGAELNNLLASMNASQISQLELITNPSAKYDASGNAGIINVKTKKNEQSGFNGNLNVSAGRGFYNKNNNALNLNFRQGKVNTYLIYSSGYNKTLSDIYALRDYHAIDGSLASRLDQSSILNGNNANNNIKLGADLFMSGKTQFGAFYNAVFGSRTLKGHGEASWIRSKGEIDSTVLTNSYGKYKINNSAIQTYLTHQIKKDQKLSIDFDALHYKLGNDQNFENELKGHTGHKGISVGSIPNDLKIWAAKVDYQWQLNRKSKLEIGAKTSKTKTDNLADYKNFKSGNWIPDYSKSNHFLYNENIAAAYSSLDYKVEKWSAQLGLRFEHTSYNGLQKGNILKADSSFSKRYKNLFPSAFLTYQIDPESSLSLSAGRRIDRPAFQKLNPIVFIVNKYTHMQGNPYFLPQDSWNFDLTHTWKGMLITSLSYANIKNYFSQIFFEKEDGILAYSEGNVGKMQNYGVSVSVQLSPYRWWNFSVQSIFNHKKMSGYRAIDYNASINQIHTTMSNAFTINKTLNTEISGFYTSKALNDIQEQLLPTGQVSIGLAQTLFKGHGTLRFSVRDLFYSQTMKGHTYFPNAYEYFEHLRDSRVATIGFSYRFGKQLNAVKRGAGSASEEMKRANN